MRKGFWGGQCTQDSISRSGYTPTNQPAQQNSYENATPNYLSLGTIFVRGTVHAFKSVSSPREGRMLSNRVIFWYDGTSDVL